MLSEWLLLDQDEATVQELTAEDASPNASGWLHQTCNRLFHTDMFAHIRSSDTLLRIHSIAEQFDPAAEALFGPFQVRSPACCIFTPFAPAVCVSLCWPFASALRFMHKTGCSGETRLVLHIPCSS